MFARSSSTVWSYLRSSRSKTASISDLGVASTNFSTCPSVASISFRRRSSSDSRCERISSTLSKRRSISAMVASSTGSVFSEGRMEAIFAAELLVITVMSSLCWSKFSHSERFDSTAFWCVSSCFASSFRSSTRISDGGRRWPAGRRPPPPSSSSLASSSASAAFASSIARSVCSAMLSSRVSVRSTSATAPGVRLSSAQMSISSSGMASSLGARRRSRSS